MASIKEYLKKQKEKNVVSDASPVHKRPVQTSSVAIARKVREFVGVKGTSGRREAGTPSDEAIMAQARSIRRGSVEDFYRALLQWDLLDELRAEVSGNIIDYDNRHTEIPDTVVPDRFESVSHYLEVWTPLVRREIRAQVLSSLIQGGANELPMAATLLPLQPGTGAGRGRGGRGSAQRFEEAGVGLVNMKPEFDDRSAMSRGRGGVGGGGNGGGGGGLSGNSLVLVMARADALTAAMDYRSNRNGSGAPYEEPEEGEALPAAAAAAVAAAPLQRSGAILAVCLSATNSSDGTVLRLDKGMVARELPADRRVFLLPLSPLSTWLREYDVLNGLDRVPLLPRLLQVPPELERKPVGRFGGGGGGGSASDAMGPPPGKRPRLMAVKPEAEEMPAAAAAVNEERNAGGGGSSSGSGGGSSSGSGGGENGESPAPIGNLGRAFTEWMNGRFNGSQMEAIRTSVDGDGFTLIKGPPGTGKTTTLKALLNAIHQREYNKYYAAMLEVARAEPGAATETAWQNLAERKPHVLVAAPSNVAVDNIVQRIMEEGFLDGNAQRYNPPIARVGRGTGTGVKAVSIEEQVAAIVRQPAERMNQQLHELDQRMAALKHVVHTQRHRVRALALATPYPMPPNWEVRVNEEGRAYYVDHALCATQWTPPPPQPTKDQALASNEAADAAAAAVAAAVDAGRDEDTVAALRAAAVEAAAAAEAVEAAAAAYAGGRAVGLEAMPEHQVAAAEMLRALEEYERTALEFKRYRFALQAKHVVHDINVRQQLEVVLLDTAHIVLTTLSSSGLPCMDSTARFGIVVIDEAAQAVEPSTLIPLRLGSRHCILVGDPQQLSATVFSQGGKATQYDRSLFQRLEACGHPVHMLNKQYRMHPKISAFPRAAFYDSRLLDGPNVLLPEYSKPYHRFRAFRPFVFINMEAGAEERGVTSLRNVAEAMLAVNMYTTLRRLCGASEPIQGRVGIITPYAQQVRELQDRCRAVLGPDYRDEVEISTVDGFQGREKDVIIVSCVRAAGAAGIGFLADVRRMNVALTRGKFGMYVIGRESTLRMNRQWSALIESARDAGAFLTITDPNAKLVGEKEEALLAEDNDAAAPSTASAADGPAAAE